MAEYKRGGTGERVKTIELLASRLYAQLLSGPHDGVKTPAHVVQSMCAMQAQEYGMAKWAVGLRLWQSTAADVEQAFQRGEILRTHILRPTWHFVHPNDIRWLVKLTAPHVHAKNKYMYKKTELDTSVLNKACTAIENALEIGTQTREELQTKLSVAGIEAEGHRLAYIMMYAELEGLIASGARRGKQFTYTLMDRAAPGCPDYTRAEMLVMLARRYFISRAPATVRDFAYWSGLSMKDALFGTQELGEHFYIDKYAQTEYIFSKGSAQKNTPDASDENFAFLMPDYDEYGMSYKDRTWLMTAPDEVANASVYSHWLIVNGAIAGTWSPPVGGGAPDIRQFDQTAQNGAGIECAKLRYMQFWA